MQRKGKGDPDASHQVLVAVSSNGSALQYASAQRRQDRALVLTAVARNGRALQAAAPHLWDDEEVVRVAVANDPTALALASPRLRKALASKR